MLPEYKAAHESISDDFVASSGGAAVDLLLFGLNLDALMFNVQPQARIDTHILIGNPYQGKPGNQITPPATINELVMRDEQQ